MNPVFVLIVVIGILSSIANKKRKEEMKKRAEQPPSFPPQHSPYAQKTAPSKPVAESRSATKTTTTAPNKSSSRGVDSKWPWPTADEKAHNKSKSTSSNYSGTPRYTHVVTSTLEGGHTHTESSMTGEENCPTPKPAEAKHAEPKATAVSTGALLNFQPNSVLQGVLYSEILGKPKALQRN